MKRTAGWSRRDIVKSAAESAKVVMAALSLAGVATLTVWHGRRLGVLGRVGALVFGAGYLAMLCVEVIDRAE